MGRDRHKVTHMSRNAVHVIKVFAKFGHEFEVPWRRQMEVQSPLWSGTQKRAFIGEILGENAHFGIFPMKCRR